MPCSAPDTALIDSLELAARAFRTAAGRSAERRELILLTDLWEDQKRKMLDDALQCRNLSLASLLSTAGINCKPALLATCA